MSDYYCTRDGKKLEYDGESWVCRHCGFHDCSPPAGYRPMTQPEARDLVREVRRRPPFSPKCRGRLHHRCAMSSCGCFCHDKEAS